jgi:hypothetical protein
VIFFNCRNSLESILRLSLCQCCGSVNFSWGIRIRGYVILNDGSGFGRPVNPGSGPGNFFVIEKNIYCQTGRYHESIKFFFLNSFETLINSPDPEPWRPFNYGSSGSTTLVCALRVGITGCRYLHHIIFAFAVEAVALNSRIIRLSFEGIHTETGRQYSRRTGPRQGNSPMKSTWVR